MQAHARFLTGNSRAMNNACCSANTCQHRCGPHHAAVQPNTSIYTVSHVTLWSAPCRLDCCIFNCISSDICSQTRGKGEQQATVTPESRTGRLHLPTTATGNVADELSRTPRGIKKAAACLVCVASSSRCVLSLHSIVYDRALTGRQVSGCFPLHALDKACPCMTPISARTIASTAPWVIPGAGTSRLSV